MNLDDARQSALRLMRQHGLRDENGEWWTFKFDNARRRFGYCDYENRVISQSRHLAELNDEYHCEQNVLHEIAHALAGSKAGHGPRWRRIARAIGDDGQRCYGGTVKTPEPKWQAICWKCGPVGSPRHKRNRHACTRCLTAELRSLRFLSFRQWQRVAPVEYKAAFDRYTFRYEVSRYYAGS